MQKIMDEYQAFVNKGFDNLSKKYQWTLCAQTLFKWMTFLSLCMKCSTWTHFSLDFFLLLLWSLASCVFLFGTTRKFAQGCNFPFATTVAIRCLRWMRWKEKHLLIKLLKLCWFKVLAVSCTFNITEPDETLIFFHFQLKKVYSPNKTFPHFFSGRPMLFGSAFLFAFFALARNLWKK